MEKIDHLHMTDGCRRTDEMLAWKINEIVDWINEREKNNRHKLTVDDWKKLGGGEGPSQGGSMTQNENANI